MIEKVGPTIYKGDSIYKTGAGGGGGVKSELNIYRYGLNRFPWFNTPSFNLVDCDEIEEKWEFTVKDFYTDGFSICNGQWFTGSISFWRGIAIYISTSQISFAVGSTEHLVNQSYTPNDKVVLNIKTDINNAIAKVYYDDVLVQEYTANRSDLNLTNDMYFRVGGLRYDNDACLSGTMNLSNCFIKLNGVLAWGIE